MSVDNQLQVKMICVRIALLMEHQEILPDLKEIAQQVYSQGSVSDEYLRGAGDALSYLIDCLEQKGKP